MAPAIAALLFAGPAAAQSSATAVDSPQLHDLTHLTRGIEDPRPGSHWMEGAIGGGFLGALLGGVAASLVCTAEDSCGRTTAGYMLSLGTAGTALGALIGGTIPKPAEPTPP